MALLWLRRLGAFGEYRNWAEPDIRAYTPENIENEEILAT